MKIELNYSNDQAKQLFESFGLQVVTDKVIHTVPIHGSAEQEFTTTQLVVVNPDTKETILLENALKRLITRKLFADLFWVDKMEVLDALNCKAVKDPFENV